MMSTYDDAPMYHGPTSLTHAHSLHVPGTVSRPRNPPPYEPPSFSAGSPSLPKSILTTSSSPPLATSAPPPLPTGPLPAEAAGGQPSFPPASVTPTQFLEENGAFSTEKMQNYPLILQLLKEHRQSMGQLNGIANGSATQAMMSNGLVPPGFYANTVPSGILSHHRRPSSCIDLSTLDGGIIGGGACKSYQNRSLEPSIISVVLPTHRGDYYFDSATLSQNLQFHNFVPMTTGATTTSSSTMTSSAATMTTMSSHQQHSVKTSNNFARIEQHNG